METVQILFMGKTYKARKSDHEDVVGYYLVVGEKVIDSYVSFALHSGSNSLEVYADIAKGTMCSWLRERDCEEIHNPLKGIYDV